MRQPFVPLLLSCCALAALFGCTASPSAPHGEARGASASGSELGQSDVNRMATLSMRENLDSLYRLMDSLYRLMDKLYRRNPAEWRKTSTTSREQAMEQVRTTIEKGGTWAALQGRRDIAAMALALAPEFAGDRVAAFIFATADMLITAHDGKVEFFLLDSLDAQHIYNAARNVEIAVWMLSQRRTAAGQPLLLADEIGPQGRNLSFEREFGKIIGRLDLLAAVALEKYRRAAITYVQGLVGGSFLQFLPVR